MGYCSRSFELSQYGKGRLLRATLACRAACLLSILLLLPALAPTASAQESDLKHLGTWNIVHCKVQWNERWNVFGEAQIRSLRLYDHFHYYEVKGGATYQVAKGFSITAACGNYDTYREGGNFVRPMQNNEFRTWLQAALKQTPGRVIVEHRYRLEQRWTSAGYRNRFRQRLNIQVPVNGTSIKPGVWSGIVWNELFFTNRAPYFERNRFFAGISYECTSWWALQGGYVYQFDYKINDETGRNFFQIAALFSLK